MHDEEDEPMAHDEDRETEREQTVTLDQLPPDLARQIAATTAAIVDGDPRPTVLFEDYRLARNAGEVKRWAKLAST